MESSGLIFISHSSLDKDFVGQVIKGIPKSHLFYDVDTIDPGDSTVEALDDGLHLASVFAMFVSPNTPESAWVEYESALALIEKVKRNHIKIVSIPIKGATHKDAPNWMQRYTAVPEGYGHSDIARLLRSLLEDALCAKEILKNPLLVGRESLCNRIIIESRSRTAMTGIPTNFVVLSGLPGMGRTSVAKKVLKQLFPGARSDFPIFELPRHGDALELFIELRQDIVPNANQAWLADQIAAFPTDPEKQADLILANLLHFAKNQSNRSNKMRLWSS